MRAKVIGMAAAVSGVAGFLYTVDPKVLIDHMSIVAQSQIAQTGFFFTLAAWLHAGRVKKEIKESFISLTTALNSLGDALRKELQIHAEQLNDHKEKLDKLGSSVQELGSQVTTLSKGEANANR